MSESNDDPEFYAREILDDLTVLELNAASQGDIEEARSLFVVRKAMERHLAKLTKGAGRVG